MDPESNASESMLGGGYAKYAATGSDSSKLGHCLNIHTQLTCRYIIGIRNFRTRCSVIREYPLYRLDMQSNIAHMF